MLRYFFILIFLLARITTIAQDHFANDAEAQHALTNVLAMTPSASKVSVLVKLSEWLRVKSNRTDAELQTSYSFAQQALALSIQLKDLRSEAASHLQLSKTAFSRAKLDEGEVHSQKAIAQYKQLQLPDELGEAYVSLWSIGTNKDIPYPDRIRILQQADTAFIASGNKRRQADCLVQIGDLSQAIGEWGVAVSVLEECLRLYLAVGYKELQSVYDVLGNAYYLMGEYKNSIEYGLLAAKTADKLGDTSMMTCTIYNHLGMAYRGVYDFPHAKTYYLRSLGVAQKYQDLNSIMIVAFNYAKLLGNSQEHQAALNIMNSLRKAHPSLDTLYRVSIAIIMIEAYSGLHKREQGLAYCRIADEEIARGIPDYQDEALLLQALITFYFNIGEIAKATHYAIIFDRFCQRVKSRIYERNNRLYKFKVDSAQGHYASAIDHFQGYMRMKDSLLNEQKLKQIDQLSVLYETEKKDKNIRSLQQQTSVQDNQIKQEKIIRNFILTGALLLILVAFLLYRAYQTKQKNNLLLQAHQLEIEHKNNALQKLVIEKEWLMKEIHHRVKNNLHMVVGLLASQAEYIKGGEALDAINESQHRIQAMSLIHQKLYQAENLSTIDMSSYIHELMEYLKTTFDRQTPIRFTLDIARVSFPLSHSIPIGLILNEAVTNAIKYAFPGGREGEITIRLVQMPNDHFTLSIHDNGIGLPAAFNAQSNTTLGTTLMYGLSGDIDARFSMLDDHGTHIDIDFTLKPVVHSKNASTTA